MSSVAAGVRLPIDSRILRHSRTCVTSSGLAVPGSAASVALLGTGCDGQRQQEGDDIGGENFSIRGNHDYL